MVELAIEDRVIPKKLFNENAVKSFIEKQLLPAINSQPADKAHNMFFALQSINEVTLKYSIHNIHIIFYTSYLMFYVLYFMFYITHFIFYTSYILSFNLLCILHITHLIFNINFSHSTSYMMPLSFHIYYSLFIILLIKIVILETDRH